VTDSTLLSWLRTLDTARIAEILRRRPEVLRDPAPDSLDELAERLASRWSVIEAVPTVDAAALTVLEAVQATGAPDTAQLAALFGPDAGGLDRALDVLERHALIWSHQDRWHTSGLVSGGLTAAPLGLGPPLADLLPDLLAHQLRTVLKGLGVKSAGVKAELAAELTRVLTDGERVRAVAATAPAKVRPVLDGLVWHDPYAAASLSPWNRWAGTDPGVEWAGAHGLLLPVEDGTMVMPREVSFALRGPGAHVPLPAPPTVPTVPVEAAGVDREAALAARAAVDSVDRLLACADTGTVTLRKDGMVGVREIRRLAREIGASPVELRFWLEVAYDADLFGQVDGVLALTDRADAWRAAEPADRYAALAATWWESETPLETEDGGPLDLAPIGGHRSARRATLRAVAGLDGAPESSASPFSDLVAWYAPIAGVEEEPRAVEAAWAEAGLLGLVAHGAASALGRGLLDGDVTGPARRLLPAAVDAVTFQADLTAMVAGSPSARVADLLGRTAEVEARGTASVWRFSPASVLRALDAGSTADDLVAELAAVATASLPQPLEYLIRDSGRRHGQVQVRRAMCCVCADDPALLAEIAGHRKLAALGLVRLAPTVLACATPLEETLAALRAAGYAPVGREASGAATVERAARRRAEGHGSGGEPATVDLMALAAKVRKGRPRRSALPPGLAEATPRLSQEERQLIGRALAEHMPVWIEYVNREGSRTKRVVEPTALDLPFLEAWCQLRDDERVFHLGRIQAVWPAGM
jgi:hypothetical protein